VRDGPICNSRAEKGEQQRLPLRLLLAVGRGLDRTWDEPGPDPRSSLESESMSSFSKQKGSEWASGRALPPIVMPASPVAADGTAGEKGLVKLLPLIEMTALLAEDGGEKGLRKFLFLRGIA
jgi:hypothetical protein